MLALIQNQRALYDLLCQSEDSVVLNLGAELSEHGNVKSREAVARDNSIKNVILLLLIIIISKKNCKEKIF